MGDLEAKLLYCDTVGYCSSSDEDVKDDKRIDSTLQQTYHHHDEATGTKQLVPRNYRNTGPKGVLEDYKICKEQLEEEEMKRYEQIIAQAKMCTLSGESENDNLEEIRRKRLLEMKDRLYAIRKDGRIGKCKSIRLAKVLPLTIGMSPQFKMKALPALQVYRDELLVGNFIRITDQLGEKFTMDQLIRFLSENEIELEISKYPSNIEESYGDEDTTGVDDGY
uniref:Phosducin domain-containing protein n=1 Tax=Loa loa TaxID=7209 RepID=A0A1I7W5B7_LOALO